MQFFHDKYTEKEAEKTERGHQWLHHLMDTLEHGLERAHEKRKRIAERHKRLEEEGKEIWDLFSHFSGDPDTIDKGTISRLHGGDAKFFDRLDMDGSVGSLPPLDTLCIGIPCGSMGVGLLTGGRALLA